MIMKMAPMPQMAGNGLTVIRMESQNAIISTRMAGWQQTVSLLTDGRSMKTGLGKGWTDRNQKGRGEHEDSGSGKRADRKI